MDQKKTGAAKSKVEIEITERVKWQLAQMSAEEREQALEAFKRIAEDPLGGVLIPAEDLPEDARQAIDDDDDQADEQTH